MEALVTRLRVEMKMMKIHRLAIQLFFLEKFT